jgi:hypothetical protein
MADNSNKHSAKAPSLQQDLESSSHELLEKYFAFYHDIAVLRDTINILSPALTERDSQFMTEIMSVAPSLAKLAKQLGAKSSLERRNAVARMGESLLELKAGAARHRRAGILARRYLVVSLVARLDELTVDVATAIVTSRPSLLEKKISAIPVGRLFENTTLEQLREEQQTQFVETLLRGPHAEQFDWIDDTLKTGLRENFDAWPQLMELVQRRHLFVHTGGRVSASYIRNCPSGARPKDVSVGTQLEASDEYLDAACDVLVEFALRLCQSVVRRLDKTYVPLADTQITQMGLSAMRAGQLKRAERFFRFAYGIPPALVRDEETRCITMVNLALARYKLGDKTAAIELLDSADWSHTSPTFRIAVAAIREDYHRVVSLAIEHPTAVSEQEFRLWPVFDQFRVTAEFPKLYRRLFRREYQAVAAQNLKRLASDAVAGSA